jgi:hypothetical protein
VNYKSVSARGSAVATDPDATEAAQEQSFKAIVLHRYKFLVARKALFLNDASASFDTRKGFAYEWRSVKYPYRSAEKGNAASFSGCSCLWKVLLEK